MWSLGTCSTPFHSIGLTCSRLRLPFGGIPHVRHTHMVNNSGCASTTTICILWIHVMKDTGTGFLSSDCSWLFQLTTLSHLQWVVPLGDVQHSPAEWKHMQTSRTYLERMTPRKLRVEFFKTPNLTILCNDPFVWMICPVAAGSLPDSCWRHLSR